MIITTLLMPLGHIPFTPDPGLPSHRPSGAPDRAPPRPSRRFASQEKIYLCRPLLSSPRSSAPPRRVPVAGEGLQVSRCPRLTPARVCSLFARGWRKKMANGRRSPLDPTARIAPYRFGRHGRWQRARPVSAAGWFPARALTWVGRPALGWPRFGSDLARSSFFLWKSLC
jgi:hypothetical protein